MTNAPVLAPGAVEFEILSGYNPLPAKLAKEISAETDEDGDATKARCGAEGAPAPKSALPRRDGVVKAPAQKGSAAMTTVAEKQQTAAAAQGMGGEGAQAG